MSRPLLTDFYQLTMLETYLEKGLDSRACFEFFVRRLPPNRNFLVAAGLEQALEYLEGLSFGQEELGYLERLGFGPRLLDYLEGFSFTGDVWAMPEGTIFFENEPILRVEAPLPQAQLVETRLINILHLQTLIASKAVRAVIASQDGMLIDFGFRRAHGADAGLYAARACYIAGFSGTATVEAGMRFGIPVTGTMAHSFILAHPSEEDAFRDFLVTHPENPILLIDTFDTLKAARLVTRLYHEFLKKGIRIKAVRLDSGDLLELSRQVRQIFDQAGLEGVKIFCSGGIDEFEIHRLKRAKAPIDGYGLGTIIDTSADAPYLDCAYKMVEYDGRPRMKFSSSKVTLPYRKQVFRLYPQDEGAEKGFDTIAIIDEDVPGHPLLKQVMENGRLVGQGEGLEIIRERLRSELKRLPSHLMDLYRPIKYPLRLSPGLSRYLEQMSPDVLLDDVFQGIN